jgi:medium-chain acyl-[acyl-carrier-protein] hydrolase
MSLFDLRYIEAGKAWRCFCFPYAGGGHSIYAEWPRLLAPHADVCPVVLPGRGAKFNEPAYSSFSSLIDDLETAILSLLPANFVFFGHSMGATIAYELAYTLYTRHGLIPRHLFVSGAGAPHVPNPEDASIRDDMQELPEADFIDQLRRIGGTPSQILEHPELLAIVAPIVRADMRLHDSYGIPKDPEARQLPCPITALGGTEDLVNIPEHSLREWGRYTTRLTMHLVPGDHFFVHDQAPIVTKHILESSGNR